MAESIRKYSGLYEYEMYRDNDATLFLDKEPGAKNNTTHFHSCFEILYVKYGSMRVEIDGEAHTLHEGQFIPISSFSLHNDRTPEDAWRWCAVVPLHMIGSLSQMICGNVFENVPADDDGTIHDLFTILFRTLSKEGIYEGKRNTPGYSQLVDSLATSFVSTSIARCGLKKSTGQVTLIHDALRYIHQNYRNHFCIPDFARSLYTTQKRLSDEFHRVLGITVTSYINHLRAIDVCTSLSRNPDLTVEKASEQAGFGSVRSMLRAYKAEYGCTPTEHIYT